MNLSDITKNIRSVLNYGTHIDPERDWSIVLAVSGIVFVAIVAWNIWAFDAAVQGQVIGGTANKTKKVFSQSSLDTIHAVFEQRAAENQKYVDGTYSFADPSR